MGLNTSGINAGFKWLDVLYLEILYGSNRVRNLLHISTSPSVLGRTVSVSLAVVNAMP